MSIMADLRVWKLSHGVATMISLISVSIPYSMLTCASAQTGPAHDTVVRQMTRDLRPDNIIIICRVSCPVTCRACPTCGFAGLSHGVATRSVSVVAVLLGGGPPGSVPVTRRDSHKIWPLTALT
jgi:hypothetical protein